jgi:hypothetical protein
MKTIEDVKQYMRDLAAMGRAYHWDDSPTEISWDTPVDVDAMQKAHDDVWAICNPWTILDDDSEIAKLYNLTSEGA